MPSKSQFPFLTAAALSNTADAEESARGFLTRFGYLPAQTSAFDDVAAVERAAPPAVPDVSQALRRYQRFHGLPITGKLDAATAAQMSQPRCGFPDVLTISEFAIQGNKWDKKTLTYTFVNFGPDLTEDETRASMKEAFTLWSAATPLRFEETTNAEADLRIRFVTGDHGDGSPFDGPGQVLAHAFFPPPNAGDFAGDLHFDEAEVWHIGLPVPAGRFDFITVAAHEIGHSIGLAHSEVSEALMFPSYKGPHRFLAVDDKSGIQTLYGALT